MNAFREQTQATTPKSLLKFGFKKNTVIPAEAPKMEVNLSQKVISTPQKKIKAFGNASILKSSSSSKSTTLNSNKLHIYRKKLEAAEKSPAMAQNKLSDDQPTKKDGEDDDDELS